MSDTYLKITRSETAIRDLQRIAEYIKPAEFPGLAAKIRSAIKSAQGAHRNAISQQSRESK